MAFRTILHDLFTKTRNNSFIKHTLSYSLKFIHFKLIAKYTAIVIGQGKGRWSLQLQKPATRPIRGIQVLLTALSPAENLNAKVLTLLMNTCRYTSLRELESFSTMLSTSSNSLWHKEPIKRKLTVVCDSLNSTSENLKNRVSSVVPWLTSWLFRVLSLKK